MAIHDEAGAQAAREKKALRNRIKTAQVLKESAVRALYKTPDGRAYLRWLLEVSKAVGASSYRGDPYHTAFACGENNVGLQIMAHMIEVDAIGFADLLKENELAARETRKRAEQLAAAAGDGDAGDGDSRDAGNSGDAGDAGGLPETYT